MYNYTYNDSTTLYCVHVCLHCLCVVQRYAGDWESGEGGGGGTEGGGEEKMYVISRNSLITPVEMVGADKINKKTRFVKMFVKNNNIIYNIYIS